MMFSNLKKAVISAVFVLALPVVHAGVWTGHVSGYLGHKSLDDDDWPRLDSQIALGVLFDVKQENWPVSIAIDFIVSADVDEAGSREDTAGTFENHVGIRKIFEPADSSIRPYVGTGIAFVSAALDEENGTTRDDDDRATGAWIGLGAYFELNPQFSLGLDVRYSEAELTLFNIDREAGGLHTGITAGYHW